MGREGGGVSLIPTKIIFQLFTVLGLKFAK